MDVAFCHKDIHIRPLVEVDAPALFAAVRDSVASLSYWFPWCKPDYSLTDAESRVDDCLAFWRRDEAYVFGVFNTDESALLGCVGLNDLRRDGDQGGSANLGYWIGEAHRGRGIATAAARMTAGYGFDNLRLSRLEIAALPHNLASQRVAEKLGADRDPALQRSLQFQGDAVDGIVYSLTYAQLGRTATAHDAKRKSDAAASIPGG